jgi:hypothetical protein
VHPNLAQALATERIRDWQQRAEQARWIKEARNARPARPARPARELVAAALAPLGIRRVPPAQPAAGRTGPADGRPAPADERRSAGTGVS